MRGGGILIATALALAACAPVPSAVMQQESAVFTAQDLDKLDFLLGRWVGTGPDGKPFYEVYRRADATTLVSERYADKTFAKVTDGSTIALKANRITSTWGEFTWVADRIAGGFASFAPDNAPSAFTWRRVDSDTIEVTQKWTDEAGKPQSYALQLKRAI